MSFQVQLKPSGRSFSVEPGETLLDAALRQGLLLPYGCRSGACGTCMGRLVSGTIHYDGASHSGIQANESEAGKILVCQAIPTSDLLLETRELAAPGEIEIKNLPARVADRDHLTHDIMRVLLKLPSSERLQYMAGQYIDILLKDGRRRSFSIANAPHDDEFIELHIRLIPGGEFTHFVFDEMKPKAMLRVEGPLGSYYLREDSTRPVILMGGGTGFAPLKGMLEHAFHIGFDHPLHLFWGVRAQRDLYHLEELERWTKAHPNFRYTLVLSEPNEEEYWVGEIGWVMDSVLKAYPDLSGHDLYMSGPPVMIDASRDRFLEHGLPVDRMFSDAFEFAADTKGKSAT